MKKRLGQQMIFSWLEMLLTVSFRALAVLVGLLKGHPAHKNLCHFTPDI